MQIVSYLGQANAIFVAVRLQGYFASFIFATL